MPDGIGLLVLVNMGQDRHIPPLLMLKGHQLLADQILRRIAIMTLARFVDINHSVLRIIDANLVIKLVHQLSQRVIIQISTGHAVSPPSVSYHMSFLISQ